MSKVAAYGIEGTLFNWIYQYYFLHLSLLSVWRPSGSVLGPLPLCWLFINRLPNFHVQFIRWKLSSVHIAVLKQLFFHILIISYDWSQQCNGSFQLLSTNFIPFGNQNIPSPVYSLGDIVLPCVTFIMSLGIYISFDLKLSAHCSRITATAFGIAS